MCWHFSCRWITCMESTLVAIYIRSKSIIALSHFLQAVRAECRNTPKRSLHSASQQRRSSALRVWRERLSREKLKYSQSGQQRRTLAKLDSLPRWHKLSFEFCRAINCCLNFVALPKHDLSTLANMQRWQGRSPLSAKGVLSVWPTRVQKHRINNRIQLRKRLVTNATGDSLSEDHSLYPLLSTSEWRQLCCGESRCLARSP